MAYESELNRACTRIEEARNRVARAMEERSRGGSLDAVNKANRALADEHARYREISGGRVPDRR
jgi:hypothetical protein